MELAVRIVRTCTLRNYTDMYSTELYEQVQCGTCTDFLLENRAQFVVMKIGKSLYGTLLYVRLLYELSLSTIDSWDLCHNFFSKSVPTLFAQSSLSLYLLIILSMISSVMPFSMNEAFNDSSHD